MGGGGGGGFIIIRDLAIVLDSEIYTQSVWQLEILQYVVKLSFHVMWVYFTM